MFSSFFLAGSELTNNHLKLSNERDQHIVFFVFLFSTPAVFFLKRNTGLKKGAIIFRFTKERKRERERTLNYVNFLDRCQTLIFMNFGILSFNCQNCSVTRMFITFFLFLTFHFFQRKTFGIRKSRVELGKKLLYFEMYLIKFFYSQEKRACDD